MIIQTIQNEWQALNQATETVSAGRAGQTPRIYASSGATTTLTVNLPVLTYGTTWATAAQNPAKWPSSVAKRLPIDANNVRIRFLVADSDNDQITATIWGKDHGGAPFNLCVLNPIQSGTGVCDIHPVTGESLIHMPFTSGSVEPTNGETVTGGTTGHTATVDRVCLQSGTWAGGTAAGVLYVKSPSNTFQAAEELDFGTDEDAATATSVISYFRYADLITVTTDHCSIEVEGTSEAAAGILEARLDLLGATDLFCDFDCDLGSGTDGTDGICLYKTL